MLVSDHRIRLTDEDIALIVASLASRRAMSRGSRRLQIDRLIARLSDGGAGNPVWRLGIVTTDTPAPWSHFLKED